LKSPLAQAASATGSGSTNDETNVPVEINRHAGGRATHVRFGSFADKPSRAKIRQCPLWSKSRQMQARLVCPLCANSETSRHLFDHLVGASKQRGRNGENERLRGLEVHKELEIRWQLNRQILDNEGIDYAG
jgi:hypothetical protein